MTAPDYKTIAEDAVSLLCTLGYLGLDRSQERRLWQEALNLDPPRREPASVTSTRGNAGEKQESPRDPA